MKALYTLIILLIPFVGFGQQTLDISEKIYEKVEIMPRFDDCKSQKCSDKKINEFISKNTVYPKKAKNRLASGTAYIIFVVDKKGYVVNVELLKSSGNKHLDKEALRVINSLPKIKPGLNFGKKVNVKQIIPVKFTFV